MALAIDSSTSSPVQASGSSSASTTASFSPPANSGLLVCALVAGGVTSGSLSVSSITDSLGSHLTYSLLARSNAFTAAGGSLAGTAELWWANCASAQTGMSVTTNFTGNAGVNAERLVGVVVFTGAATTQNGATNTGNNSAVGGAAPSLAVTPNATGSIVVAAIENWSNATGPTIPGDQSDVFSAQTYLITDATDGSSDWLQRATATTSAGVSVTINDTAPSINYNMAMAEILASSVIIPAFTPQRMPLGV